MKKLLQADWRCSKGALVTLPLMILGIYVVGTAFLLLVMHYDDAEYFPFATMLAIFVLFMYASVFGQQFANGWHLAGAMSVPRWDFCWYMVLRQLVITAISYGMILVLRFVEDGLVRCVFGTVPNILDCSWIYRLGPAAAIIICSLIYQLLAAAVVTLFGQQGSVWFYLASMGFVLIGTRFQNAITYIAGLPFLALFLGAGIMAAACLTFAVRTFRTMAVK